MNPAWDRIIGADDATRAGLFATTAVRIGTTPSGVEKDFWVCWTLDALFNGLAPGGPRLLFKGGTSLSKGFGLIDRFSEDIDITVFRDDLNVNATVEELAALSGKKRTARLNAIADACRTYIRGPLKTELTAIVAALAARHGLPADRFRIGLDADDDQTLLVWYPPASPVDAYVRPAVKIEAGAKSALDPNTISTIRPYVDDDTPGLDLAVPNVVTVDPQRTFWDKVVILHGLRRWHDKRGELRGGGQRISRHYYDIHRLMESDVGRRAMSNKALGADCVAHARMFFDRPDYDLASARAPNFAVLPHGGMVEALRRDYAAMAAMIFGPVPEFDRVLRSVAGLEGLLNSPGA